MRRYAFQGNLETLPRRDFDVVIVGNGVAGLYAAINLDPRLSCAVLNKSGQEASSSELAQGGIAAVTEEGDTIEEHFEDTIAAGAGLNDPEAVRTLVSEGPLDVERLIEMHVPFDLGENGKPHSTREGAHRKNRILHCGGDATGHFIVRSLLSAATRDNIQFLNNTALVDVVTAEEGETAGIIALNNGLSEYFAASKVIIAAGGIGRVYRNSTNFPVATGDGIAASVRAGAVVKDMEFVQFHPTGFIHPNREGRFFLISEAVRGEGGVLRNRKGDRFMLEVHDMADLAPRDIVARAIIMEMQKSDIPNVYLDVTARPREFLKERFPTIYNELMHYGIDMAIDWIPVIPVQHYFMGGIMADLDAKTNIPGLYAAGESACSGVHGANRLASNSLLECLVFGRRAAQSINRTGVQRPVTPTLDLSEMVLDVCPDIESYRTEIRETMTKKGGIVRDKCGLTEGLESVSAIKKDLEQSDLPNMGAIEALNMATVGEAILSAALERSESIGAHYRIDEDGPC